ncbi:retrovirus-related Pol polyprotein from transposon 17.6 [Trichonephila clavipes]|nr:retrovirus-related Pol polyprotein from transposon 17.6 [Trichonephila clavipes]
MNKSSQSNFSLFAANNTKIPAYGMVRKKDSKPLNWSSEAITAFQRGVKQALADAALLAHPSPSAPLALHVDASDYAIGGALHQVVDSELQPLAFFSRKLTSSEKSYSAYDRELLAIYSAIRHFRYMLEARDFTVFTDHKPLTYAFRQKSDKCSPRQIRQLDFISQFYKYCTHSGSDNIAADVLSRISAITFPSQIDYDCIAETQQTDQELHTLIASGTSLELKEAGSLSPRSSKLLANYLVFRKCRTTGYHPQANGMIEELHRPLKSAIKCHATELWTEVLPIILLGLRASLKEDILCTPAELVLGSLFDCQGDV